MSPLGFIFRCSLDAVLNLSSLQDITYFATTCDLDSLEIRNGLFSRHDCPNCFVFHSLSSLRSLSPSRNSLPSTQPRANSPENYVSSVIVTYIYFFLTCFLDQLWWRQCTFPLCEFKRDSEEAGASLTLDNEIIKSLLILVSRLVLAIGCHLSWAHHLEHLHAFSLCSHLSFSWHCEHVQYEHT